MTVRTFCVPSSIYPECHVFKKVSVSVRLCTSSKARMQMGTTLSPGARMTKMGTVTCMTIESCRARESTTRFIWISILGFAVCALLPTLTHAQAVTITGDARVTHNERKIMPELNTVDAPVRVPAPRAATED